MSNLENVKLSNTSKMIVAAAAVTAGTLVQVNQNNQMVNADETKAAIKNLGQSVNTYKVQSGDTLTKIAKANDVSLDDLVKFNGIADKNMIIVGETLQLSANDDVKSTDVTTDDTYTAVDGTNISDLQYNANADADNDNFMTVSEYNAWVNGGRQETVAPSEAATDDAASTETAAPSEATTDDTTVATSDANVAVDGTNVADLQYNANADADNDNFMTVSEYNAWVNGGRQETVAPSEAATDDAASTETAAPSDDTTVATSDANAAVDGTNVADLQYNTNADADNDGFMTVSEYNAWVNGGRQETVAPSEATTDDAASTETAAPSEATTDDTTVATSDANAAVDGTNVADLQYNANADADNDGFMTVSEYNAWVNGGRQETVVAPKATTDDAASTETTTPAPSENTTTNNNSQNQGSWYDVAMSLVGIPYVWGGHTPSAGLDCSGFTAWVYNHSGMTSNFPAYTVAQENATTSISVSAAQPGDLLFWGTPGATYHVGIYLGNNQFIAAPQPGDVVRVQTLTAGWMPSFAGTLR